MKPLSTKHAFWWGAACLSAATIGYLLYLRPKHLRWGSGRREAEEYLPGDELIPDAESCATHAIFIDAPVEDVWPWIAQIGQDKAGFYSYTMLENLVGCEMHNAKNVHDEWQTVQTGDLVRFHPDFPPVPVVLMVKGEHMVLGADLNGPGASTWTFVLRDLGHGMTRLVVRLRGRAHRGFGRAADLFLLEPAHFVMERKMMLTIKKLAERRARKEGVA